MREKAKIDISVQPPSERDNQSDGDESPLKIQIQSMPPSQDQSFDNGDYSGEE